MAEDSEGRMWFGVDNGVQVYDGVTWSSYTSEDGILGDRVSSLLAARDGSVYAGTGRGISRFSKGEWSHVFPVENDIPVRVGNIIQASDGSVWAATGYGVVRISHTEIRLYTSREIGDNIPLLLPGVSVLAIPGSILPTRTHRDGLGVQTAAVGRRSNRGRVILSVLENSPAHMAGLKVGDRIAAVDGDPTKRLLVAPGTSVRLTIDRVDVSEPFELTVKGERIRENYSESFVGDVYEDSHGNIWFGMQWGGEIIRHNPTEGTWRLYAAEDGLDTPTDDNPAWPSFQEDQEGFLWVGYTHGYLGVNKLNLNDEASEGGKAWSSFLLSDLGGEDHNAVILETRDGTLWVGGHRGVLNVRRNGEWTAFEAPDIPTGRNYVVDLLEASDGALWVVVQGHEAFRLDFNSARWSSYKGLSFQCESADGTWWFTGTEGQPVDKRIVVRYHRGSWTRYGAEDGLIDRPGRVFRTTGDEIWVVGAHDSTAATGVFDGTRWTTKTHPGFGYTIWPGAVHESSDGSLWFGAPPALRSGDLGGVLRFDGRHRSTPSEKRWTHFSPPGPPRSPYGIGETRDGTIWFGGGNLVTFDGQTWTNIIQPKELGRPFSDVVYSTPYGDLWIGHRLYGVFHFDGTWTRYDVRDGLAGNQVGSILKDSDGSIWVLTRKGISRFDGKSWTDKASPYQTTQRGVLAQTKDGAIWVSTRSPSLTDRVAAFRFQPDKTPPETQITLHADVVSQPGNTTLAWKGADPWRDTPDSEIQYAWRLNKEEWSPFSRSTSQLFETLNPGDHHFEVKARDRDFNEDPTPATVMFTVVPPVWQEPWFIGMVAVLLGGIGFQTNRLVRRDKRLQEANLAMSSANKELFGVNRELTVEAALDRVRGRALSMEQSEEILEVSKVLAKEFEDLGLPITYSAIVIVDEDQDTQENWITTGGSTQRYSASLKEVLERIPSAKTSWEARSNGEPYCVTEFTREEWMEQFLTVSEVFGVPQEKADAIRDRISEMEGRVQHVVFFSSGSINLNSAQRLTDAELGTAKRFAEVFGFAYNRFLELKTAESQARGSARRAAVDRIRAEVTAMRNSDDLVEVVAEVNREMVGAGVKYDACAIQIVVESLGTATFYWMLADGTSDKALTTLSDMSEEWMGLWRAGVPVVRMKQTPMRHLPGIPLRDAALLDAPFEHGAFSMVVERPGDFSEEDIALASSFAEVISLGYTRHLDFQQLEEQNRALQREGAVARIRSEVQAMERASDFERVLSVLAEDLKTVGLSFDTCGIDVLDEPVDGPTMAYFEENGFHYTTYTIDPEGQVTDRSYRISAPIPEVIQETIERFIEGQPWTALIGGTNAILEVPTSNYGRLRITSSERTEFTEEDVESLQDFAGAIALGYARYLDIREIQDQTERKSRFLANMSHELRTPMNAIIGFTRMVLRRGSEQLSERHKENLNKVTQSADHLLNLINSILDLSKIEAGRMDVEVSSFEVKGLIEACCANVTPLVKTGVLLRQEIPEDIGQAETDEGRLRQIVINLISNALKFTDSGQVTIEVSKSGTPDANAMLAIMVADTGSGIPEDALNDIFEEFQQVKGSDPHRKGTGLGLPITKGFAELLGGSIHVQSEVGKGSRFTVRVPVVFAAGS